MDGPRRLGTSAGDAWVRPTGYRGRAGGCGRRGLRFGSSDGQRRVRRLDRRVDDDQDEGRSHQDRHDGRGPSRRAWVALGLPIGMRGTALSTKRVASRPLSPAGSAVQRRIRRRTAGWIAERAARRRIVEGASALAPPGGEARRQTAGQVARERHNRERISHRSGNAGRNSVPRRYSTPLEPPVPVFVPIVRSTIFTCR